VGLHDGVVNAVLGAIPELKSGQSRLSFIKAPPYFQLLTGDRIHVSCGVLEPDRSRLSIRALMVEQAEAEGCTHKKEVLAECEHQPCGMLWRGRMIEQPVLWLLLKSVVVCFRDQPTHSR